MSVQPDAIDFHWSHAGYNGGCRAKVHHHWVPNVHRNYISATGGNCTDYPDDVLNHFDDVDAAGGVVVDDGVLLPDGGADDSSSYAATVARKSNKHQCSVRLPGVPTTRGSLYPNA